MTQFQYWAIALALRSVVAFKDTSPFFLFSTSQLLDSTFAYTQLTSSSSLNSKLSASLDKCPSDTYIIVSQPGVTATDYSAKLSSPHLGHWLNRTEKQVHSTLIVPEVAGDLDAHAISKSLEDKCKAEVLKADAATGTIPNDGNFPRIVRIEFSPLPTVPSERISKLAEHDSFLHAIMTSLGGDKYTVVYTTSPPAEGLIAPAQYSPAPVYEMDEQSALHTDLKRDLDSHSNAKTTNLALFDTYQFLSPGIFMGVLVFLLLFLILYVGISAVAGLQVSYFAFSKEMGPAGQKKGQ
ncbi:BIG1-domain-containing protein [Tothia fuscella]|uniref:Protein BIG1 n=1 Tax=Tothia fuscella TaxID=1048955 RepID=A0A9P4NPU7_9PEZI|nr:BIG1-domain-containing protein [Tothia fuscella]